MHRYTQRLLGRRWIALSSSAATQHQHSLSFQTFYPRHEPRLKGTLLSSLTGFTSSACTDGGDLLCVCVSEWALRRQMFPSKGLRKEMQWRHISCVRICFPFSPTSFPSKPCSKNLSHWASQAQIRKSRRSSHNGPAWCLLFWIFFILICQEGLQDRGDFSVGWLTGGAAGRSCSNDKLFQVRIMKNSLSINKRKQTACMGISTDFMLLIQWEIVWVEVN